MIIRLRPGFTGNVSDRFGVY